MQASHETAITVEGARHQATMIFLNTTPTFENVDYVAIHFVNAKAIDTPSTGAFFQRWRRFLLQLASKGNRRGIPPSLDLPTLLLIIHTRQC